jgi:hypothetical protein
MACSVLCQGGEQDDGFVLTRPQAINRGMRRGAIAHVAAHAGPARPEIG